METAKTIAIGQSHGKAAWLNCRYLARHGIIAGSTGTGKSRAMQVIAEQLYALGVNVFVSDVKGDASGFCVSGSKDSERNKLAPFVPHAIKTNYWSVSQRFAEMRFSVAETGSILFSRLLSLNPTQESHLAIAFSYAKKKKLPLDSIEELLDILDAIVKNKERGISTSSVAVIQRKLVSLEESGIYGMFGKPSFEIEDLKGLDVLNLSDARKNMLASIAPAFLINKLFNELGESEEAGLPKYAVFFDEAHYLFKDANKSLKDLMVTMLKQIRSKGVAVFFVTQDVSDLPEEILSQLATKIIFSQKIFTEKGAKRLNALAKSFPKSPKPKQKNADGIIERLKTMPTGSAIVSTLDEKGNQTQALEVRVFAPATTMEIIVDETLRKETDKKLIEKYAKRMPVKKAAQMQLPKHEERKAMLEEPKKMKALTYDKQRGIKKYAAGPGYKSRGFGLLDAVLGILRKILLFILDLIAAVIHRTIIKPVQGFALYFTKKPVRILWLALLAIVAYAVAINWEIIESYLRMLKLS